MLLRSEKSDKKKVYVKCYVKVYYDDIQVMSCDENLENLFENTEKKIRIDDQVAERFGNNSQ